MANRRVVSDDEKSLPARADGGRPKSKSADEGSLIDLTSTRVTVVVATRLPLGDLSLAAKGTELEKSLGQMSTGPPLQRGKAR